MVERHGYSHIKNLLLQECYIFIDQLPQLKSGVLKSQLEQLYSVIKAHLETCGVCRMDKTVCEVCYGQHGDLFYVYQSRLGAQCKQCSAFAHVQCL